MSTSENTRVEGPVDIVAAITKSIVLIFLAWSTWLMWTHGNLWTHGSPGWYTPVCAAATVLLAALAIYIVLADEDEILPILMLALPGVLLAVGIGAATIVDTAPVRYLP